MENSYVPYKETPFLQKILTLKIDINYMNEIKTFSITFYGIILNEDKCIERVQVALSRRIKIIYLDVSSKVSRVFIRGIC